MSTEEIIFVTPSVEQLTSIEKNVLCTQEGCGKTFIHNGALRMHLVKSHGQKKDVADKRLFHKGKIKNKLEYRFSCPTEKCQYNDGKDRHFSSFHKLKQHYMKVHAERCHECNKCERTFSRENDLRRHEGQCGVLYQCETCPVKYTTTEALRTHCTRQKHKYPEEYARKTKKSKAKAETPTVTRIPVIPVMLISVPPSAEQPASPLKQIKPKQTPKQNPVLKLTSPRIDCNVVSDTSQTDKVSASRQDALIQTDIFGVSSLSVSGRQNVSKQNEYNPYHLNKSSKETASIGCQSRNNLLPQKRSSRKSPAAKRKLGIGKDAYPSSPRRKKMRSSTGIQTSVSLTRKQSQHTVSGTQTTGDYILKTAMAQADIQIERKTVASQVTPSKYHSNIVQPVIRSTIETQTLTPGDYSHGRLQPVLVDSFSQVKQRNIWAETSHNLAESQTMTDLPPSISTQTLQSYLVNQKERRVTKKQLQHNRRTHFRANIVACDIPNSSHSTSDISPDISPATSRSEISGDNVVKIYDTSLTSSVSFVAPDSTALKHKPQDQRHQKTKQARQTCESGTSTIDSPHISLSEKGPQHGTMPSLLPSDTDFLQDLEAEPVSATIKDYSVSTLADHSMFSQTDVSSGNQSLSSTHATVLGSTGPQHSDIGTGSSMTDTEAQAMMSADEFESLLHSSGIFLDNFSLSPPLVSQSSLSPSSITISKSGRDKQCGQDFDFIGCHVNTADTNTQTGTDLGLFDSYGSIDTNTQTAGDMDFLDLVMTNMETQTLNENDLLDLGLSTVNSHISTQSLGVGTSDFDWTRSQNTISRYCSTASDTADIFLSPSKPLDNFDQSAFVNQSNLSGVKCQSNQLDTQSACNLQHDGDRITSVMETQTVAIETSEPLIQTETQTQVEYQDLETMNMETQTTLEDLQQLCDWFE